MRGGPEDSQSDADARPRLEVAPHPVSAVAHRSFGNVVTPILPPRKLDATLRSKVALSSRYSAAASWLRGSFGFGSQKS